MEVRDRIRESEDMIRTGRYQDAIALLTRVLADDPDDLEALLNVGIAYTENGENDKAIRTLEYYTARDKENPEAWEALGCAYLRKQDYAHAEEFLNVAREYAPDNASILRNLSVLLTRTDRGAEGFALLKRARELNPQDYLTTFAIASAYRALNQTESAKPLFEELASMRRLPSPIREEVEKNLVQISIGW